MKENAAPGKFSATRSGPAPAARVIDCGDLDIRIARDGIWYYRGSAIQRLPIVKLFASVLRREAAGEYFLVTPVERGRIAVEDVPFLAVELTATGCGHDQRLMLRTNLDEIVTAGPGHPLRFEHTARGEAIPYVLVRDRLEARLSRPVFYELVGLGTVECRAGETTFGVWSDGMFFRLGEPGPDWQ